MFKIAEDDLFRIRKQFFSCEFWPVIQRHTPEADMREHGNELLSYMPAAEYIYSARGVDLFCVEIAAVKLDARGMAPQLF